MTSFLLPTRVCCRFLGVVDNNVFRHSPDHGSAPQVAFSIRTPANNGHGMKLHQDTIMAGVECLATLVLDCGLLLPPPQVQLVGVYRLIMAILF